MKSIGSFFSRVFGGFWGWIKETAWVQPLLIVGIIFSVIFSIPTISEWVQGIAENINSAESYYRNYQRKLEGEEDSQAQKLIDAMMEESDEFGEKFMLAFVQVNCQFCTDVQPAFKLLQEDASRFYGTNETSEGLVGVTKQEFGTFKFYTIFIDEEFSFPEDETTTPFQRFLNRNEAFLERTADVARNSWYFINGFIDDARIETLEGGETNAIPTPTVIMYDLSTTSPEVGISELVISVPGASSFDKATFLSNAWMHRSEFAQRNL
jgi:hypothetical protein